jgi:putative aldouronate transport system permease protein
MDISMVTNRQHRVAEKIRHFAVHTILVLVALCFIAPLVIIVTGSFSDNHTVLTSGYRPWPVGGISLEAYEFLANDWSQILNAYRISIVVTATGTVVGLIFSSMLAYALSRRTFKLRRPLSFLVYFTMLFNGGIIPYYMLVTQTLKLRDTLWALILPPLVVPFYVLILRTNLAGLPEELLDAAKVDGASELRIFTQIVMPLTKPALVTIGLFYVLLYWNNWGNALLFIRSPDLMPLQYLLYRIMANLEFLTQNMELMPGTHIPPIPLGTIRMALATLAALPIAIIFMFLQRYFVRGLTVGAFK